MTTRLVRRCLIWLRVACRRGLLAAAQNGAARDHQPSQEEQADEEKEGEEKEEPEEEESMRHPLPRHNCTLPKTRTWTRIRIRI